VVLHVHSGSFVHGSVDVTAGMVSVPLRHAWPSAAGGSGHACAVPADHS